MSGFHYLRLSLEGRPFDALSLRKLVSDALATTFGATSEATYLDILWLSPEGNECVIRANSSA